MEGQVPRYNNDEAAINAEHPAPTSPLPPPPGRPQNDMYIIQFPKDQVYRVPPRENADIMERYRKPPKVKRDKRVCCGGCGCGSRLLLTLALIVISIVAIVGITLATLYFIYNPAGPTFTVTDFVIKNNKNSPSSYEISLKAKNPNERLGIHYENSAEEVSLMFEETEVAAGKFPPLDQDPHSSNVVKIELIGSNGPLPKQMAQSMGGGKSKSNAPIALELDMKLGVKIAVAGLHTWVMKSNVVCKFKVSGLGNDARILSQECDTNFKQY